MEHVNSERKKKVKALYSNKGIIINIRSLCFPSLQILTTGSYTVLILKGKVPSGAGGEHTFALQGRASKEGAALWMDANTAGKGSTLLLVREVAN